MKLAADLHIHSALSPCADDDMTPNNIVNMALIKGLDVIAVTDHNSAANVEAVVSCGMKKDILVIPAMEIETSEEVHLLCYFPTVKSAIGFQAVIHPHLPSVANREDIFGRQLIIDGEDKVTGVFGRLLLNAVGLGIEEITGLVREAGGSAVPAHVDREAYSILANLGAVPSILNMKYLELSGNCDPERFISEHPEAAGFSFLKSSDAHHLGDISERENFIELREKTARCFLELLGRSST